MRAVVSGQLGMALIVDGGGALQVDTDEALRTEARSMDVIAELLREAADATVVDVLDLNSLNEELERVWRRDRALQLILIVLDAELSRSTRSMSAEALVDIWNADLEEFVSNRLYSAPLPPSADTNTAIELLESRQGRAVSETLLNLVHSQAAIRERLAAWSKLPYELFGGASEKARFKMEAVSAGAFRLFASEKRGNVALFQLLIHEKFRGNARARRIFQEWAAPFQETLADPGFSRFTYEEEPEDRKHRRRNSLPWHIALERVNRQKDAIKRLLQEGQLDLALRYTRELVHSQRLSDEEHVAKSLCDLSQFAKQLGNFDLQSELAEWATREAPNDAWSFAQLGDALRALGEFEKAREAYHRAGVLGEPRVALVGEGQLLKDLGQLQEALVVFDACAKQYPGDLVPLNARASALADFGRLAESLKEYEELLNYDAYNVITRSGKAQVLRQLGRYEEALRELDSILRHHPRETYAINIRAEVLRETGRLNEALAAFIEASQQDPLDAVSRNGVAHVLRELGRISESLREFDAIIADFPWHMSAYLGAADTYKKSGDLSTALSRYDEVLRRFRAPLSARVGKASVLAGLKRYGEAFDLLPTNLPATRSEWAAYHVRGMIHLRLGEVNTAESILERGSLEAPWFDEQRFFAATLAAVKIRRKHFTDALSLLEGPAPARLELIVRALSIHAYGELGRRAQVKTELAKSWNNAPRSLVLLKERLTQVYLEASAQATGSDVSLYEQESESLLLVA